MARAISTNVDAAVVADDVGKDVVELRMPDDLTGRVIRVVAPKVHLFPRGVGLSTAALVVVAGV